ncbi:MAG: hypothetical protein RL211_2113 [Pseudomonadota bacterium]|jgi:hypothetical protein
MQIKVLVQMRFRVVAICDGADCPAEAFIKTGEDATKGVRDGLFEMLGHVAERGLQFVPSAWWHEVDKARGIYEFRKGPLRLFFFKGAGRDITVCTSGVRKSGQKVDKQSVNWAAGWKADYDDAVANGTLEVVDDETE